MIKVDAANAREVISAIPGAPEFRLHDYDLTKITFNKEEKILIVWCTWYLGCPTVSPDQGHIYRLTFHNVIGFFVTSCGYFCGPYELTRLNGLSYIPKDRQELIPKLFEKRIFSDGSFLDVLKDVDEYFECCFEFISADTLTIACEYLIAEKILD